MKFYDMNHLVLDCYKHLGKPKKHLVHFPYWPCILRRKMFRSACVHPAQKVHNKLNPCKEVL